MLTKTTEGKLKDVDLRQVTAENYIVPNTERHVYHVKQEMVRFSSLSGARISHPRIQKYGKKAFDSMLRTELARQGLSIEILYDPTEYLKERAAETARLRTMTAAERKAERQAEIDAAVAAALEAYKAAEAAKRSAQGNEAGDAEPESAAEKKAAKTKKTQE